ncbi:hypothetical protein [Dictyobacter aurantiacus]|uniref:hypothetical protein n=1 Tax=Dictyobacter aurantiacus TaxID=1936993 RepID=UPI000F8281CD|nr:hypothetical protein [Dictyobacter aurantiacus]
MKICTCGNCEECHVRAALLEFARQREYAPFEWLPSSTIVGGEKGWHAFARTHTVRELFWVLHVAKESEGYIAALEFTAQ